MERSTRRGFTLVELLVATGVFVIGFAAVFALFLSGVRFRKLADDTTLTATLASSLMTEVYLDSGSIPVAPAVGPAMPVEYDGDGRGNDVDLLATNRPWTDKPLFAYPGVPGTAYRIGGPPPLSAPGGTPNGQGSCCDVIGGQDPMTTALVLDVIALCPGTQLGPPNTPVPGAIGTLGDLERRVRLNTGSGTHPWDAVTLQEDKAVAYENELVARGIALRYRAVMVRRPHWMP